MPMQPSSVPSTTPSTAPLLVACLCAQWCTTCREHEAVFLAVQLQFFDEARFVRVDIEDEAELLDGVEIENFPTLLIARGDAVLFFGTITPHAQTLARLVAGALGGDLKPLPAHAPIDSLVRRLRGFANA